jgi:thiol-disulfide isomerase/thioredoxin
LEIMQAQVEVWSNYVCPFCNLEQPMLERIAQEFGARVGIRWRAFELRPDPIPTHPRTKSRPPQRNWRGLPRASCERQGSRASLSPWLSRIKSSSQKALAFAKSARRAPLMPIPCFNSHPFRSRSTDSGRPQITKLETEGKLCQRSPQRKPKANAAESEPYWKKRTSMPVHCRESD